MAMNRCFKLACVALLLPLGHVSCKPQAEKRQPPELTPREISQKFIRETSDCAELEKLAVETDDEAVKYSAIGRLLQLQPDIVAKMAAASPDSAAQKFARTEVIRWLVARRNMSAPAGLIETLMSSPECRRAIFLERGLYGVRQAMMSEKKLTAEDLIALLPEARGEEEMSTLMLQLEELSPVLLLEQANSASSKEVRDAATRFTSNLSSDHTPQGRNRVKSVERWIRRCDDVEVLKWLATKHPSRDVTGPAIKYLARMNPKEAMAIALQDKTYWSLWYADFRPEDLQTFIQKEQDIEKLKSALERLENKSGKVRDLILHDPRPRVRALAYLVWSEENKAQREWHRLGNDVTWRGMNDERRELFDSLDDAALFDFAPVGKRWDALWAVARICADDLLLAMLELEPPVPAKGSLEEVNLKGEKDYYAALKAIADIKLGLLDLLNAKHIKRYEFDVRPHEQRYVGGYAQTLKGAWVQLTIATKKETLFPFTFKTGYPNTIPGPPPGFVFLECEPGKFFRDLLPKLNLSSDARAQLAESTKSPSLRDATR